MQAIIYICIKKLQVIGHCGLLRKKTRILVTSETKFLEQTDYIIVMKNQVTPHIVLSDYFGLVLSSVSIFCQFFFLSIHSFSHINTQTFKNELVVRKRFFIGMQNKNVLLSKHFAFKGQKDFLPLLFNR